MKQVLIFALLAAALAASPAELRVTAVRCWSLPEATRVVIQVSGEFTYHAERAHHPERVFFDIFRSRPHIAGRRVYSSEVGDRLVKRVRVAETLPGVTRVVLDLDNAVEYTATQLSNPDRLVVELRSAPAAPTPLTGPATPSLPPPAPPAGDSQPSPALAPAARPAVAAPPAALHPEASRAAKLNGNNPASLTRALGLKIRRVVLDPGHGGHDTGTIGPTGYMEKDLVLDVALRLGKLIEQRMGSEVIYTRTDDTFVPLEGRTALANEKKADLFLSIHANSSPYPHVDGVETYYLNLTDSKDALEVAARENASSEKSVFELRDLIQKITLQDKAEESKEFAARIQASLFRFAARYNHGLRNRGVKKAPFVVLIGASMPSVLAEVGFLSNPREEAMLKRPAHRQRLAEALYRGVYRYAQSLSHFQMAQAGQPAKN
jgi:N-acetylmuramoyl-L-alanine amidase